MLRVKHGIKKFCRGDFSLKDESCDERSQKTDTDNSQAFLDINSTHTENEFTESVLVTQEAISVRLHTIRNAKKEDEWVSYKLSGDNKNRRRNVFTLLYSDAVSRQCLITCC